MWMGVRSSGIVLTGTSIRPALVQAPPIGPQWSGALPKGTAQDFALGALLGCQVGVA